MEAAEAASMMIEEDILAWPLLCIVVLVMVVRSIRVKGLESRKKWQNQAGGGGVTQ